MYHFILQILIMLSLGLMVYMAARKIPQITDTVMESQSGQPSGFWHRVELVLGKLPLDRFDFLFSQFLEKNVRKMKLLLAQLDNYLAEHLEQFKKIKHRAHRKQQKKFALFEEQAESKEEEGVLEKTHGDTAEEADESTAILEKTEGRGHSERRVENTK